MKEFVPDSLKYKEVKNKIGIECTVFSNHGNTYAATQHTYSFELSQSGKEQLEQLLVMLPLLKYEIQKNGELCLEDYCEKIAKKLNIEDDTEVIQMIDSICRMDIKFEEVCAIPSYYQVKFYDGQNTLNYQANI